MEIARRLILPFLVVLMQIQKMSQFKIDSSPSTSSSSAGDLVVIVFPKDNPQVMSRIQQQQQISDNLMHSASNEGRRYATQSETTAVLSRNSLVDLSPSVPLMPSDAPAIMLPVHNNHHLQQQPTNDDQFDERHIAPLELVQSNSSPSVAKRSIRRCGMLLIKHLQAVCNGCLKSGSDSEPVMIMKKRSQARIRRDIAGFVKITDMCCRGVCSDADIRPLCC